MARTKKPTPLLEEVATFVRVHLGRDAFAPFTGTDAKAWHVFVHAVALLNHDQRSALTAMRAAVMAAQHWHVGVMQVFVQSIPAVLDWSDGARYWPQVYPNDAVRALVDGADLRPRRRRDVATARARGLLELEREPPERELPGDEP